MIINTLNQKPKLYKNRKAYQNDRLFIKMIKDLFQSIFFKLSVQRGNTNLQ